MTNQWFAGSVEVINIGDKMIIMVIHNSFRKGCIWQKEQVSLEERTISQVTKKSKQTQNENIFNLGESSNKHFKPFGKK